MRRLRTRAQRGLTLIEMMIGLAITAFLAVTAAPYFADYTANSRLRESGHLLYSEALLAQSEALKRNASVRLQTDASTIQVIDRTVPAAPVVLRTRSLIDGVTASATTIDFDSQGRSWPDGGAVDVSMNGIACSPERRCPGLRVEAGGAVRLCADRTASAC
jgi:type IV fimbrial biogenesis protein FimT